MRSPRLSVELPTRWVQGFGAALIVLGLALPLTVLVWRMAHQIPEATQSKHGELRPELVVLPAGEFRMGSPETEAERDDDEALHSVMLSRPFAISRTEVTQGQYMSVMGEAAIYRGKDVSDTECLDAGEGEELPVVCVTWLEAVGYANALSKLDKLTPAYVIDGESVRWSEASNGYRLPTEAEWEYAARAATETVFVGTNDPDEACVFANVADLKAVEQFGWPKESTFPCDDSYATLSPVRARRENGWGLFGFGGNVSEWVWDWSQEFTDSPETDPTGPDSGVDRVVRGGSWNRVRRGARVAFRYGIQPSFRDRSVGFRLARSCLPSALLPFDCFRSR